MPAFRRFLLPERTIVCFGEPMLFGFDIRHRQQPDASLCLEYSPEEYAFDSCVGSPAGG